MAAIELSARIAAQEASVDGICWTFSPMVDVSRDPRWGRVSEGSGEDPYLGSRVAEAMVRGYQGPILSCAKHFALYGASEAGRDYNTVDMSRIRMYNDYFPPYKAAVDAGVASVMASFNEIDGIPATGNKWLLTDVLRDQWGFQGFVQKLKTALKKGLVSMNDIDTACRRILEAKYKLGLFSDPYKFCRPEEASQVVYCQGYRDVARRIASESFVLLKNDGVLPLKKQGTIGLVGPLADTRSNMPGTWSVAARLDVPKTIREGLVEAVAGKAMVLYAKGSNLVSDYDLEMRSTMFGRELGRDHRTDKQLLDEALAVARSSDVIIAALGESSEMSGESSSRTDISIPDVQKELLKALVATGKPVVLLLFNGRPLTLNWEAENVPAILDVWFGGSETADAVGSTTRPVRELKGFQKIYLEPGESKIVSFEITPELMSHYNSELKFVAEPGEFIIFVGTDSETRNSSSFTLR